MNDKDVLVIFKEKKPQTFANFTNRTIENRLKINDANTCDFSRNLSL